MRISEFKSEAVVTLLVAGVLLTRMAGWGVGPAPALKLPGLNVAVTPRAVFVAATAYDANHIESGYSAELATSTTSNSLNVAWSDADTNVVGYRLYWGTNSGVYPWTKDVGNVTQTTFTVIPQAPPVPIYYAVYGQSSSNATGPFVDISTNPIARFTNLAGGTRQFYRLREWSSTNAIP